MNPPYYFVFLINEKKIDYETWNGLLKFKNAETHEVKVVYVPVVESVFAVFSLLVFILFLIFLLNMKKFIVRNYFQNISESVYELVTSRIISNVNNINRVSFVFETLSCFLILIMTFCFFIFKQTHLISFALPIFILLFLFYELLNLTKLPKALVNFYTVLLLVTYTTGYSLFILVKQFAPNAFWL